MTLRQLLEAAGDAPYLLLGIFLGLPLMALLLGKLHGRGRGGLVPFSLCYAALVYASTIAGMGALVLVGYALFFTDENLLDVNLLVYFLPVLSMAATLVLVSRNVSFERVPGFGRLSGLMLLVGLSFALVLFVHRSRIWVVFGGGIWHLVLALVIAFVLLRIGAGLLFRRRR